MTKAGWSEYSAHLRHFALRYRANSDGAIKANVVARSVGSLHVHGLKSGFEQISVLRAYFAGHVYTLARYGFGLAEYEVDRRWCIDDDGVAGQVCFASIYAERVGGAPLTDLLSPHVGTVFTNCNL